MPRQNLPLIAYVASRSDPTTRHAVKAKDGKLTCSCGQWVFNKAWQANHAVPRTCHHTDEVTRQLRADNLTVVQAIQIAQDAARRGSNVAALGLNPVRVEAERIAYLFRGQGATRLNAALADEIEQAIRRFASTNTIADRTTVVIATPSWLGGGRAIILRD